MITIKSDELKKFEYLKELLEENISEETTPETTCYALWGNNSLELVQPKPPASKKLKKDKDKKKIKQEKAKEEPSLNPLLSQDNVNNLGSEISVIEELPKELVNPYPILRLKEGIFAGYSSEQLPYSLYYAFESDVYYNFKKESNIESLLRSNWIASEEEWNTAHLAIQMINKYGITKYSEHPPVSENIMRGTGYQNILLVDQPVDDESVLLGNATEETFNDMLLYAFDNYQYANIYVKLHPETINGKKEGYLQKLLVKHGLNDHPSIKLIDTNCNITSVFHFVQEVFVVTSQVGFEALLRNKNVRCFGLPFYSGWGLTNDMQTLNIPKPSRSLMDLFIALILKHTLYINPFTGKKGTILDLLDYVSIQQRHSNRKNVAFYNTSFVEHKNIDKLLNVNRQNFSAITKSKQIPKHIDYFILTDKKSTFEEVQPLKYRAFLSESFLFSNNVYPEDVLSLIVDHNGPYYDPQIESDLDYMLNHETYTDYEVNKANKFIDALKFKFLMDVRGQDSNKALAEKQKSGKKVIFVPGQIADSEVTLAGGGLAIPSDYELLVAICQKVENYLILYKPAPGSKIRKLNDLGRDGLVSLSVYSKERHNNIVLVFDDSISHCIDISDEIHLINHNCGIEAIVKGKKVVTYGLPFYGALGLTEDRQRFPRIKRQLSLEEFVLATYMLYPRYKLPNQTYFTTALNALEYDKEKNNLVVKPNGLFSKLKSLF